MAYTRRHVIKSSIAVFGTLCSTTINPWLGRAMAAGETAAGLVVINAKIYTVDDEKPVAEAFAVKNGRFIAVGRNDEIRDYIRPGTEVFDAQGRTIVPGFIDAHIHANGYNLLYSVLVGSPFSIEFLSKDTIIERLKKKADQLPENSWVIGTFFDDTKVKDGPITRQDLDKVSLVHPVRINHRGGHTTWVNSKALELAKVTKDTPNPSGGEFFRDESGELTGRVAEHARDVFNNVGILEKVSPEEMAERNVKAAAHMSAELAKLGVTSVQSNTGASDLIALQRVLAEGMLQHRHTYEVAGTVLDGMIAAGIRSGFGNDWLRLGGQSEYTADGSFSERTMSLAAGYPDTNPVYRGILTRKQEELDEVVFKVHRAGITPNIHANGDTAIANALTAFERAYEKLPVRNWRPKITHCTLINDDLLARIKKIGAVPAPFTTYTYYNTDKFKYYGKENLNNMMAFRSFIDRGIIAAAGSDFGPGPISPLMGIQGMVTRKGWNGEVWGEKQHISVSEALRIYTINGAYATYLENDVGSIKPGKLADFVVLNDDPHTANPEAIMGIGIVRTVAGGRTVYQA